MSVKKRRTVFQLYIRLRDIEPAIWRRIQVWEDTKLPQLHRILQMLFNWEDYHLHDFVVGRRVYSVPDPDDGFYERKVIDEKGVPLNRIIDRVGDTFVYAYDFGDDWQHDVLLEAILLPEPDTFYPRCIAGARNGPPEDAGGPGGYAGYLEALSDSGHEEHAELLAWRGPFDPEEFPLDRIQMKLTLDHTQRLNLHALLGAQRADVGSIRAIWSIQDRLALDADEEKVVELKREIVAGQEQLLWNIARSLPSKEFEFGDAEIARIKAAIQTWDSYGVNADRRWLQPLVETLFSSDQPKQ